MANSAIQVPIVDRSLRRYLRQRSWLTRPGLGSSQISLFNAAALRKSGGFRWEERDSWGCRSGFFRGARRNGLIRKPGSRCQSGVPARSSLQFLHSRDQSEPDSLTDRMMPRLELKKGRRRLLPADAFLSQIRSVLPGHFAQFLHHFIHIEGSGLLTLRVFLERHQEFPHIVLGGNQHEGVIEQPVVVGV